MLRKAFFFLLVFDKVLFGKIPLSDEDNLMEKVSFFVCVACCVGCGWVGLLRIRIDKEFISNVVSSSAPFCMIEEGNEGKTNLRGGRKGLICKRLDRRLRGIINHKSSK